jgi:hypothetical protein
MIFQNSTGLRKSKCDIVNGPPKDIFCHNLSFMFAIKAKACKCVCWEWTLEVTFHVLRNVGKCEGMNLCTPKQVSTLGVGVLMDSQNFKEQFKGSKSIGLKNYFYHCKILQT